MRAWRKCLMGWLLGCLLAMAPAGDVLAQDMDSDGTPDAEDICKLDPISPSPCSFDSDMDGFGNRCDGDFNNDGVVNAADSKILMPDLVTGAATPGVGTDMNCDGVVGGGSDEALFLGQQLQQGVPGPSGLPCAGTVPCTP